MHTHLNVPRRAVVYVACLRSPADKPCRINNHIIIIQGNVLIICSAKRCKDEHQIIHIELRRSNNNSYLMLVVQGTWGLPNAQAFEPASVIDPR